MFFQRSLSLRLTLSFLAFVVLGSLALVLWLGAEERRYSREQFAAMARTNAEFVRTQKLPLTVRTADALGEVLGVRVRFLTGGVNPWISLDQSDDPMIHAHRDLVASAIVEQKVQSDGGFEVAASSFATADSPRNDLVLLRTASTRSAFWRGRTFAVLGAFWLLSLALAWALARGIVRPLRALAARLPRISEEKDEPIPETARTDEIGQLARAYADTRALLAAERRAREQAERLATIGRVATGLAHEINNPVAAIKLHAQLLEAGTTSVHPAASPKGAGLDSLSIILAENAKIEALVSQWMFLARPQPPALAPCDPAGLVAAVVRVQAPAAKHARVRLIDATSPGIRIDADARRLSQAIGNVIINAIQAMAARGGTLTIRGSAAGRFCEITFADTGPGFSAAALAHHAELFFSEKEGGMGIGLNVTAEILRAHGGELRVANAPEGGAAVTFVLPLAENLKS